MLCLFTPEENLKDEKEKLIYFFENGLSLLHVRKPEMKGEELEEWLLFFEKKYLQKMVLHQHHKYAEAFPVKGIHLKENFRLENVKISTYIEKFRSKGLSVSSAFHDLEKLEKEASLFDYSFLSPVFSSISKNEYKGKAFDVMSFRQKVIALGGIQQKNILKTKILGFQGIAVLGAVWLAEDPVKNFEKIYKTYKDVYR